MSDHSGNVQKKIEHYKAAIEAGIDPVTLDTLIDASKLSDIIHENTDLFDDKTKAYLDALKHQRELPQYLREKISAVRVFIRVREREVKCAFNALGVPYMDGVDMISVGESIYTYDDIDRAADGSVRSINTAALLAHELIHSIQADAHGGEAGFAAAYIAAGDYLSNLFEVAAYSFGGRAPAPLAALMPVAAPILGDQATHGSWWRLA